MSVVPETLSTNFFALARSIWAIFLAPFRALTWWANPNVTGLVSRWITGMANVTETRSKDRKIEKNDGNMLELQTDDAREEQDGL